MILGTIFLEIVYCHNLCMITLAMIISEGWDKTIFRVASLEMLIPVKYNKGVAI